MANTFPALKDEYATLWQAMRTRPERMAEIQYVFGKLTSPANKARYQAVQTSTGVPWYVIAIIHNLEAGRRFDCHLHNGDPLSARTTHVPKNRPPDGDPPFTWEESAKDALKFDGLANVTSWTVERVAFELGIHVGDKIEVGELQQLDGLHQLRRHDQRLALAEFELLCQRHGSIAAAKSGPWVVCNLAHLSRLVVNGAPDPRNPPRRTADQVWHKARARAWAVTPAAPP